VLLVTLLIQMHLLLSNMLKVSQKKTSLLSLD